MPWGWPGTLKSSRQYGCGLQQMGIYHLCLGTTSLFVTETFKSKNFETWLPATYDNGRVVKY